MVFWNVRGDEEQKYLNLTRQWSSRPEGTRPAMISFAGENGNYIPKSEVYTAAIKAFLARGPQVKVFARGTSRIGSTGRKLSNNPGLAPGYFNALARYCHRGTIRRRRRLTPVNQGFASWCARTHGRCNHRPGAWALHNYDDVPQPHDLAAPARSTA